MPSQIIAGQGGIFFVSGAYVASDLWDNRLSESGRKRQEVAMEVLKYKWRTGQAARNGESESALLPHSLQSREITHTIRS